MHDHDWYLVQTKVRAEAIAQEHLVRQDYDVYFPKHKALVKTRQGYKERVVPMFGRYLFVRLNAVAHNWYTIKNTRGVSRLVMFGEAPGKISSELITLMQQKENASYDGTPDHPISVGDSVEVFKGSFLGYRGVVESCDAKERVTLLLQYAQSYTRLTLARDDVELAPA